MRAFMPRHQMPARHMPADARRAGLPYARRYAMPRSARMLQATPLRHVCALRCRDSVEMPSATLAKKVRERLQRHARVRAADARTRKTLMRVLMRYAYARGADRRGAACRCGAMSPTRLPRGDDYFLLRRCVDAR
jgi:hypothetical protein